MDSIAKHELIGAFVEKRLTDNLEVFRLNFPDIYDLFKCYQEKRYFLIYDKEGNINVLDREEGELLYSSNPVQEVIDKLAEYIKNPVLRPFMIAGSKETKNYPIHSSGMAGLGKVQHNLITKYSVQVKATDMIVGGLGDQVEVDLSVRGLPEQINMLLFFSVGIGFDLEKLYLERDIRKLLILEPDTDIFYCSLQLIDWVAIIEKAKRDDLSLFFAISDTIDDLTKDVTSYIAKVGRHNAAGAFLYSGFYRPEYQVLFEGVKKEFDVSLFNGFGFYDDSVNSVAHTYSNVKDGVPFITSDKKVNKDFGQEEWPLFIIGNGPSLDDELEFLRENQDRIVIVSCGSSLTSLYKHDITPDFHVELERTASVAVWLKKAAADSENYFEYLKKIRMVGMSQVHPEVFSLFDKKGQMPKDNETGSLVASRLMHDKGVRLIARCAPTCVHLGFTFSVLAGFKDIHFVGVDMGFKSKDKHHSEHSLYGELSDSVKKRHEIAGKKLVEFEANFGEEPAYSYRLMPMFKRMLEVNIRGWNQTFSYAEEKYQPRVYNCSDGALITGAEPKRTADVKLESRCLEDKIRLSDSVMDSYFSFYPTNEDADRFKEALLDSSDKVHTMCRWLIDHLGYIEDEFQGAELVDSLSYGFHTKLAEMDLTDDDSWLYTLFDGTLLYSLSAMQSTLFLPVSKKLRIEAFNESVDELEILFNTISDDYSKNMFDGDKEGNYDHYFESQSES